MKCLDKCGLLIRSVTSSCRDMTNGLGYMYSRQLSNVLRMAVQPLVKFRRRIAELKQRDLLEVPKAAPTTYVKLGRIHG